MKLFFKKTNKLNRGFTLMETLVAISIFTMSILGLLSVLSQGISNTGYAKQKIIAGYLAQEGIEYARNVRDTSVLYSGDAQTSWNNFRDIASPFASITPPAPTDTNFIRTITKTILLNPDLANSNEVKITSDVKWTQGSGEHHIIFSENLFNWVQ